jgi:hypothetical protein
MRVEKRQGWTVCGKIIIFVIPSEARNLSFFFFDRQNRREVPRFARNDKNEGSAGYAACEAGII